MSIQKTELIAIRDGTAEDVNFILATWLRGVYHSHPWFKQIGKTIFMQNYNRRLHKLLERPETNVKVACLVDDPSTILGYAVYRSAGGVNVLDWVYVKSAWRKIGIAKSLVPTPINLCTHVTKVGLALKPKTCVFNPFT